MQGQTLTVNEFASIGPSKTNALMFAIGLNDFEAVMDLLHGKANIDKREADENDGNGQTPAKQKRSG